MADGGATSDFWGVAGLDEDGKDARSFRLWLFTSGCLLLRYLAYPMASNARPY